MALNFISTKPSLMAASFFRINGKAARPDCFRTFDFDGAVSSISVVHFGSPDPVRVDVQPSGAAPIWLLSKLIAWFDMSLTSMKLRSKRKLTSAWSFKKLYRALDRLPGEMSARHVTGVEPSLAQRRSRLAAEVEAIDAERDDGLGLGKGINPVIQAFRIAPDGSRHDILRLGRVVFRTGIDDLDRRSRIHHRMDFFDRDRGHVGKLLLFEWPRGRNLDRIFKSQRYSGPIDVAHECSNIGAGIRAKFQVVRMLVHIEGEYRHAPRDTLGVVRRDLIDESAIAWNIAEQYPARTTGQSIGNSDNFLTQDMDTGEVNPDGTGNPVRQDAPVAAKACKVQFMQKR